MQNSLFKKKICVLSSFLFQSIPVIDLETVSKLYANNIKNTNKMRRMAGSQLNFSMISLLY